VKVFSHEYEALNKPVNPEMKPSAAESFTFPKLCVPIPGMFSLNACKD
jgi:hypothetical protein